VTRSHEAKRVIFLPFGELGKKGRESGKHGNEAQYTMSLALSKWEYTIEGREAKY